MGDNLVLVLFVISESNGEILIFALETINENVLLVKLNDVHAHPEGYRFNVRIVILDCGADVQVQAGTVMKVSAACKDQIAFPMKREPFFVPAVDMWISIRP